VARGGGDVVFLGDSITERWESTGAKARERLRQAALKNKPWLLSTGPRTPQGKAKVAQNGRVRQLGSISVRQMHAEIKQLRGLVDEMRRSQQYAVG
jgi:hypothetical protein